MKPNLQFATGTFLIKNLTNQLNQNYKIFQTYQKYLLVQKIFCNRSHRTFIIIIEIIHNLNLEMQIMDKDLQMLGH